MSIVPIIVKIIEQNGLFYCLNDKDEIIIVTEHQEIANIYYAIPAILERQASIIKELTEQLNVVSEEYNSMIMRILPSGSRFVH
jgi:hypothetical protein